MSDSSLTQRLARLPRLGVGLSAEPASYRVGIDPLSFDRAHPGLIHFLEFGSDIARGLDDNVRAYARQHSTTYHFLDLNLETPEDLDELDAEWLARTVAAAREIKAAWLCGDAGLWHIGPRDRGHQVLLPPVLTRESASDVARAVRALRERSGFEVLPENPPAPIYLGDLHVLDYFARVSDEADTGLLLDCAHLAIFQRLRGLPATTGLDGFPLDRVVELHVAGGDLVDVDGLELVDDSHCPEPLPDTWAILDYVLPRATALKAIVYECEKNPPASVIDNFRRLNGMFPA